METGDIVVSPYSAPTLITRVLSSFCSRMTMSTDLPL